MRSHCAWWVCNFTNQQYDRISRRSCYCCMYVNITLVLSPSRVSGEGNERCNPVHWCARYSDREIFSGEHGTSDVPCGFLFAVSGGVLHGWQTERNTMASLARVLF